MPEFNIKEVDSGLAIDLKIGLPHGLHSRPSAKVAQAARKFQSRIFLVAEDGEVDAKSTLDILSLALQANAPVRVLAAGPDAAEAVTAIAILLGQAGE